MGSIIYWLRKRVTPAENPSQTKDCDLFHKRLDRKRAVLVRFYINRCISTLFLTFQAQNHALERRFPARNCRFLARERRFPALHRRSPASEHRNPASDREIPARFCGFPARERRFLAGIRGVPTRGRRFPAGICRRRASERRIPVRLVVEAVLETTKERRNKDCF